MLPGRQLLAVTTVSTVWIVLAHIVRVQPSQSIRKHITSQFLWKLQFFLHPIIIGGGVYWIGHNGSTISLVLLSPFCFNFAVEPYDMPSDRLFQALFYLHHIAPLMTLLFQPETPATDETFAVTQGVAFGHLWCLHTFFTLDRYNVVNKQSLFWPYTVQGALVFFLYC